MARPFALGVALLSGAVALVAAAGNGCSASGDNATGGSGGGDSQSVGAGAGASVSGVGGLMPASGTGSGGGCAGIVTKAEQTPLDLYVMLDQSASMNDDAGGQSKWQRVTSALTTFLQQPNLAGIGVGIQYFALTPGGGMACNQFCASDLDCGASVCGPCDGSGFCTGALNGAGDSCDANDYSVAEVEIQPLPGVASTIVGSLGQHMPSTGTPTSAALQGAIDYAKGWAAAHPTHVTAVVFATDGEPEECDTDLGHINAIASAGFGGTPSIQTFVIGVGPSLNALDGIAAAGGTKTAFHIDQSGMATQEFIDAMNAIHGIALQCAYTIPTPPNGMTIDYALVNVQYTPGGGGAPQTIGKVANAGACGSGDGWYYDNDASPTQIIMCDATCQKFMMDTTGQVDIVLGCQTVLK